MNNLQFIILACCLCLVELRSFTIDYDNNRFLKDGEPFRYISGGIHYFRVPEFYWEDRLRKMKAAGLNTIQTYVAWNGHEPKQGQYVFNGTYDVEKFIKLAQELELLVIVRAGPYICAEWEFGGFPAWLLKNRSIVLRSSKDKNYLNAVDSWMGVLLPKLKPLLYENGGPIISVQVENEYGSYYTCDQAYMEHLKDTFRKYLGNNVVLFTTDGYSDNMLKCGGIPELYRTVDFGIGDPTLPFKQQRKFQPKGPLVNSEYYTGWLDHWGEPHHRTDGKVVAQYLDKILAMNASINMYMFEGGTNFGFMNGANSQSNLLLPVPTSYDYDAPLSEAGNYTAKFLEIQQVIKKYAKLPPGPLPPVTKAVGYGKVQLMQVPFYTVLYTLYPSGPPKAAKDPPTMEEIGQNYGFLMYRTFLEGVSGVTLTIKGLRDRAVVMVDENVQGILNRNSKTSLVIKEGSILDILVENQGRINYGPIQDPKGIVGEVLLDGTALQNWGMFPITFEPKQLELIRSIPPVEDDQVKAPCLAYGSFQVDSDSADTFLNVDQWTKGQAFLNTYNLGRYWPSVGPQKTLYIPSKYLKASPSNNTLALFEIDKTPCGDSSKCYAELVDTPNIG